MHRWSYETLPVARQEVAAMSLLQQMRITFSGFTQGVEYMNLRRY